MWLFTRGYPQVTMDLNTKIRRKWTILGNLQMNVGTILQPTLVTLRDELCGRFSLEISMVSSKISQRHREQSYPHLWDITSLLSHIVVCSPYFLTY